MFLNDAAFRVEDEGSGQRGDAAVLNADVVGGNRDGIVDAEFFNECFDGVLIVVVHHEAKNLEPVFVFILEFDQIRNFRAARSAPRGPEIQEYHFAFGVRERDRFSIEPGQLEIGRRIRITNEADNRPLIGLLRMNEN